MKKKKFAKLFYSGAFCLSLFFASCGKEETPPVNNGGMSQKMDEEGLTDKQKENALPLKGKVFGELSVVGEEDAIYCNLPENILNWNSSIPLCRDPLYDILYYVDENIIYAVQNGKTEAAVELSGRRLFCRDGKLYFLLSSSTKTAVKGAKSGNILCYNPVDGSVEVVLDDVFDSMIVYQDLIYCRKIGEDFGFGVRMDYCYYFFDTRELIAQKEQEVMSYSVGIARYGKDFVGWLYGPYDRSNPRKDWEELIEKQGIDPELIRLPIGAHLCNFDGSNSRVLEGIKELPISHYIKGNHLIWLSEDGLHNWDIVTRKEEITEFQYGGSGFILVDDKLYSTTGYMENGEQKKCCKFAVVPSEEGIGQIWEFFTDNKQVYSFVERSNEDFSSTNRLYQVDVISKEEAISIIPLIDFSAWEEALNDCDCVYRLTELSKE